MNKVFAGLIAFAPLWVGVLLANLAADWWASPNLSGMIHSLSIVGVTVGILIALIFWCIAQYERLIQKFQPSTPPQPEFHDLQEKADQMDVGELLKKHQKDISK